MLRACTDLGDVHEREAGEEREAGKEREAGEERSDCCLNVKLRRKKEREKRREEKAWHDES